MVNKFEIAKKLSDVMREMNKIENIWEDENVSQETKDGYKDVHNELNIRMDTLASIVEVDVTPFCVR